MPWKLNPFTKQLTYYERGLPAGGSEGEILRKTVDEWEWAPTTIAVGDRITSSPSALTGLRVTNLWVNAATGKLEVEYSDTYGESAAEITSAPPPGQFKVLNLYIDSGTNKLIVDYDSTPQP